MSGVSEKEIAQEFLQDPKFKELVEVGVRAGENRAKLAEAAMIAAKAFEKLVAAIDKAVAKEYDDRM